MKININELNESIITSAVVQNNEIEEKTEAASVQSEKIGTGYEKRSVLRTSVDGSAKAAGIYEAEKPVEDGLKDHLSEIKEKLDELINRMTAKNMEALKEKGYSFDGTSVDKIVTVVDQIKVKLAAYANNDTYRNLLNTDDLKAVLGDSGTAYSVACKLRQHDLPTTEENVEEGVKAMEMAGSIANITKEQAGYMAGNQVEPTIENVYKAQHNGSYLSSANQRMPIQDKDWNELKVQVKNVLENAGMEANEENLQNARWMLEQGFPIDEQTLGEFEKIMEAGNPVNMEQMPEMIAQAMAKGKNAKDTLLTGENYTPNAIEEALQKIEEKTLLKYQDREESLDAIKAKRQLEEIRLLMTKEVGMKLIKNGISIETESLEKLVERLREQEASYQKEMYEAEGLEATEEKLELLTLTESTIEALKDVPAYVIGEMLEAQAKTEITVHNTYEAGTNLRERFSEAGEAYEALMTKPDKEYGDSLQSAFQNIDDILQDLNLEISYENQRAVKILAYNQMDITQESIEKVKELDGEYQYLLKNMTPRTAMHLIENQINPLNTEIHELNDELEKINKELGPQKEEKYSEFLWRLEHQEDISEDERSAYIGLYRLLNTVDRTQGAAIGALVNQGSEVTLDHLLTAARTRKAKGINVTVDKNFGMAEVIFKEETITTQLKSLMQEFNQPDEGYQEEKREQLRQLSSDIEAMRILAEGDQPVTIQNLMAAGVLSSNKNSVFGKLFETPEEKEKIEQFLENLADSEAMEEGYIELEELAKQKLNSALETPTIKHEQLQDLRLVYSTTKLMSNMAKEEDYQVPMELQGKTTAVHLKIIHGSEEKGKVSAEIDVPDIGKLNAEFHVNGSQISAFILGNSPRLLEAIKAQQPQLEQAFTKMGIEEAEITYSSSTDIPRLSYKTEKNETASKVKTGMLYKVAKAFLTSVKNVEELSN